MSRRSQRDPVEQAELDRIAMDYRKAQAERRRFEKALYEAGLYPDRSGRYLR